MTDREKLIELLDEATDKLKGLCGGYNDGTGNSVRADHLIANGVTFATDTNVGDKMTPTDKDINVPSKWISVKDRLPEEHDCFFTSFYGTEKWQDGMFLKCSNTVLASVEYEDGKIRVKEIITKDGKWDLSKLYRASKVTHWMPLPQPPKGE